jgi:hypothetical protein
MNRATYDAYLAKFNARDYRGVLEFYAPEFEVKFADVRLRTPDQLLAFYGFFHQFVNESISIDRFVSDERLLVLEARVRIVGVHDLSAAALRQAGYGGLVPIRAGQVVEIPQFIHYHLENGKFVKAVCAVVDA